MHGIQGTNNTLDHSEIPFALLKREESDLQAFLQKRSYSRKENISAARKKSMADINNAR